MAKKTKGNTVSTFALELVGADNKMRIFAEHEDQVFSLSVVPIELARKMPERPIKPECQFTFQEALELAAMGFTGDPAIGDDRYARQKLSGMVIYLASLMGMTDVEIAR